MALPRFTIPLPIRFLTDAVKLLQTSSLDGPVTPASANDLAKDVFEREKVDALTLILDAENRQQLGEEPDEPAEDDPVLQTLTDVVNGILTGQSLSEHQDKIKQYVFNQQDRAELISNLLLTQDYQRLTKFLRVRNKLEDQLLGAASRGDLTVSELLAMASLVGEQTGKLEGRVQAGASNVNDVLALLNKVDYAFHQNETALKEKFRHTSSTGREIVRRTMHKLRKVVGEA